jgi:hypothetical protein
MKIIKPPTPMFIYRFSLSKRREDSCIIQLEDWPDKDWLQLLLVLHELQNRRRITNFIISKAFVYFNRKFVQPTKLFVPFVIKRARIELSHSKNDDN